MSSGKPLFKKLETAAAGSTADLQQALAQLQWTPEGLIPAIAQQYDSGAVLMLAWMNLDSLKETLATGQVCYWSRSRQKLWRKGETSGHVQKLIELRVDCDGDTLLLLVDQTGPACHTERTSCFYNRVVNGRIEVASEPPVAIGSQDLID
jgi:phosphoribosyl-AMP cyclohydrolase